MTYETFTHTPVILKIRVKCLKQRREAKIRTLRCGAYQVKGEIRANVVHRLTLPVWGATVIVLITNLAFVFLTMKTLALALIEDRA